MKGRDLEIMLITNIKRITVLTIYDIIKVHGDSISVISNYSEPGTIEVNTFNGPPGGKLNILTNEGEGSEFIISLSTS